MSGNGAKVTSPEAKSMPSLGATGMWDLFSCPALKDLPLVSGFLVWLIGFCWFVFQCIGQHMLGRHFITKLYPPLFLFVVFMFVWVQGFDKLPELTLNLEASCLNLLSS